MKHLKQINEFFYYPELEIICTVPTDRENFNIIMNDLLKAYNNDIITARYSVDKVKSGPVDDTFKIKLLAFKSADAVMNYLSTTRKKFKYKLVN